MAANGLTTNKQHEFPEPAGTAAKLLVYDPDTLVTQLVLGADVRHSFPPA